MRVDVMSGQMESVRRNYGVPARRGQRVVYRGYPQPIAGAILSSTGSHLWIRRDDNGRRFGPLHPTWRMDYGTGRDYGAECDAIIRLRNEWLNGRMTSADLIAATAQIRGTR
jgi:hypothetical protein